MNEIEPIRDELGRLHKGVVLNPAGRPPNSGLPPEVLAARRATKDFVKEYKERLAEALPLLTPVLIAKALEGDMPAIKEVNDRVMGKSKETMEVQGGLSIQFAEVFNKNDEKDNQ